MRLILLVTVIVFGATGLAFGQSSRKNDAVALSMREKLATAATHIFG